MIRVIAIACLVSLLGMVLYLPAAFPAEHFLLQLNAEHSTLARSLGNKAAWEVLSRSLSWQASGSNGPPLLPATSALTEPSPVTNGVSREMASVNRRLFGNAYFRSVAALTALAAFRLSAMLEWLPWLMAFAVAALVDGRCDGLVKSKEFRRHDPEIFAMFVTCALLTTAVVAVAILLPHPFHPGSLPLAMAGVLAMAARSLAHFRRDG